MKTKDRINPSDIRSLINKVIDMGYRKWSPSIPYIIDMKQELIILKPEKSIRVMELQEFFCDPEVMKILAGKNTYLQQRYKNSYWINFVDALLNKENK